MWLRGPASPDAWLIQAPLRPTPRHSAALQALYPGTCYAHVSGGAVGHRDLSWEQLRDFHALNYHPSNALFYT